MAPRSKSKKAPVATRKKRVMHALFLAQPFIQFVALMAVLFMLGRCSPLSPSTDRALNKVSSDGVRTSSRNEGGENISEDQDIKASLKEISSSEEMPVMSATEFAKFSEKSINTSNPADLSRVKGVFAQRLRARGSVRLLVVNLTAQQKEEMAAGGLKKPLDLAQLLGQNALTQPELRRNYIGELHKLSRVEAKAVLVLSDDAMQAPDAVHSLPLGHKFSLGIFPSDEKAFVAASRIEQRIEDEQKEVIKSNLEKSLFMAIVLE